MVQVTKHGILLAPTANKFENHGTFNPACIATNGELHLLYRATNKANYSTIGYCRLETPTEIDFRHSKPLLVPREKYESQGLEDPRIVHLNEEYWLTYTAYDGHNAMGALAISDDLINFSRKGILTPILSYREFQMCIECCDLSDKYLRHVKMFYERGGAETSYQLKIWDKDVILFPRKINGKYAFLHRIFPDIQIAYFDKVEDLSYPFWKDYLMKLDVFTVLESKNSFEASYIGGGCPPLETEEGWLLIYHGVQDTPKGYVYHAGAALMDLNDPTVEIGRLNKPLFSPDQEWEKKGVVNNVVFPTATLLENGTLFIYYGAADKRVGVASVNLKELINELLKTKQ